MPPCVRVSNWVAPAALKAVISALGLKVNSWGAVADVVKMAPGRRGVATVGTKPPNSSVPVTFTWESDGMDKIAVVPDGVRVSLLSVTVMLLKSVVLQVIEPRPVEGQRVKLNGTVVLTVPLMRANGVITVMLPELREATVAKVAIALVTFVTSWGIEPVLSRKTIPLSVVV